MPFEELLTRARRPLRGTPRAVVLAVEVAAPHQLEARPAVVSDAAGEGEAGPFLVAVQDLAGVVTADGCGVTGEDRG